MGETLRFIGASGRDPAVQALTAAFADLQSAEDPRPRLMVLRGRPGIGKTRVAQEFYAKLATTQSYWPNSLIETDGPPLSRQRKRIAPSQQAAVGGGPLDYLWVGVTCGREAEALTDDLGDVRAILREHLESVFVAGGSRFSGLGEVGQEVVVEGVTEIVKEAAGAFVPGLGSAVAVVKYGIKKRRARRRVRESREREETPRTIDAFARRAAEFLVDVRAVSRARPELPIILAVEDVHLASPALVSAVHALFDPGLGVPARVLVVAMGWDERLLDDETASGDSFASAL